MISVELSSAKPGSWLLVVDPHYLFPWICLVISTHNSNEPELEIIGFNYNNFSFKPLMFASSGKTKSGSPLKGEEGFSYYELDEDERTKIVYAALVYDSSAAHKVIEVG